MRPPARRSLAAFATAVAIAAASAHAEIRSPLAEATAVQQQLRTVADSSAHAVYAVTAFTESPRDATLYAGELEGADFTLLAERYARSCGSAFAIDANGHLLTNEHVISGATSVWVTDDSGHVVPAIVIGSDPRSDLAVLYVPIATRPLPLADQPPARGDLVLTLGNPDGLATEGSLCASVGCVSAINRSLPTLSSRERRDYSGLIQVTTPITVGGSGGPLLDLSGRAVGIVSAVATSDHDGQAVGFALPLSPAIRAKIEKLTRGEEIVYAYLGVMVSPLDATPDGTQLAGARIDRVDADTPADGVLREGDVVTRIDGRPVETDRAFVDLTSTCAVDQSIPLTVRRGDAELELAVCPRRRILPAAPITRDAQRLTWAGVTFANASDGGVCVKSIGLDATLSLEAGAIIRHVNDQPIADVSDLLGALHKAAGKPLTLDASRP